MPFMLSNNPSSCGQKEFNQVFMINEVKPFIISSVQKVMVLTSKKETDRFIIKKKKKKGKGVREGHKIIIKRKLTLLRVLIQLS